MPKSQRKIMNQPTDICLKDLIEDKIKSGIPIFVCLPQCADKQTNKALHKMTSKLIEGNIRLAPDNYVFDFSSYGTVDHALNDEYQSHADEINDWPNCACVESYMSYGEAIYYCGNPYDGQARKDEFLAYLYAEQELGSRGYFTRKDSTPFTHYDLDGLSRIWAIYDSEKSQSKIGES
jgi:hypothetical protein